MIPQSNSFRQKIPLDGFWDFRFDPKREGESSGWSNGVAATRPIAVPASWNDQFADERDNAAYIDVLRARPFVAGEHVGKYRDGATVSELRTKCQTILNRVVNNSTRS